MKTGKIMRKLSFQFNRGLLMLLVICGTLTACSNDDWKEDVNELKKPVPSGVVLLDDAAVRVVKGNQFRITFRMNPSGTTLNREDVELDVRNSDTYFCTEQAPTGTRASYVTSSDYYELLQIEADKNEAGEVLDGQWVATVQTKGEANFRNVADLLLVVNYTDAAGVTHKVSSSGVQVEIVPTVDEGVSLAYCGVQNYRDAKEAVNPYILFVDIKAYKNAGGDEWHYDRSFITDVKTDADKSALTANVDGMNNKYYISFTPDAANQLWKDLDEGKKKTATASVNVELTDFGKTVKKLDMPVTYCPHVIQLPLELSASKVNSESEQQVYSLDMSAVLAEYGFTETYSALLTRITESVSPRSAMYEFPMVLDEITGIGRHSFKPVFLFFISEEVKPGLETGEYDENEVNISLVSMPQELVEPVLALVDVKVNITMRTIE